MEVLIAHNRCNNTVIISNFVYVASNNALHLHSDSLRGFCIIRLDSGILLQGVG